MYRRHLASGLSLIALLCLLPACASRGTDGPLERGMRQFEAEDFAAAKLEFQKALAKEPQNATVSYYLGRVALRSGEQDAAINWLQKAAELNPESSDFHLWLGLAYVQKLQTLSFFEQGAYAARAKAVFERAVELDPGNADARLSLAGYYLNAPPIAGGSTNKAKEQAEAVKTVDARRGHLLMAQIHMREGAKEAAESEYLELADKYPKDPSVFYQMGFFYQEAQEFGKAFAAFEKTLAIDPQHANALYQVGRTGVFSGENIERAIECLRTYVSLDLEPDSPSKASAHWRLGMLFEKQGRRDLAKKEYEKALALEPDHEQAREALENL